MSDSQVKIGGTLARSYGKLQDNACNCLCASVQSDILPMLPQSLPIHYVSHHTCHLNRDTACGSAAAAVLERLPASCLQRWHVWCQLPPQALQH